MINTIVFDLGNVIVDFLPHRIYHHVTQNEQEAQTLYELFMESGIWHELDRGKPLDEVIDWVKAKADTSFHKAIEYVVYHWHEDLEMNIAMESYIKELSKTYNIYLLSNVSKQFYDFKHRFEILDLFDGLYISADSSLLKPSPAIYTHFLDTYQLKAEQCFFIDDRLENIEGALSIGMEGFVYQNNLDELKQKITALTL